MNYRHAYHAGNPGDVLKHAVLTSVIERLLEKPAPVFVVDTHSGVGTYDLAAAEPGKTGEWQAGIGKLFSAPCPAVERYLALVRDMNPDGALRHYPGSPAIAASLLRPGDRLVLAELHPEDCATLRDWARGHPVAAVHHRDGYEALKAFLPPREGRGLVVIDPPYEDPDEFERLAQAVLAGHRRWPAGRWLIWHPVKDRAPVWRLQEALIEGGVGNLLSAELLVRPEDGLHLAGSGVLLVNPPYGIEDWLSAALPALQTALAPEQGSPEHGSPEQGSPEHGSHALRWLGRT